MKLSRANSGFLLITLCAILVLCSCEELNRDPERDLRQCEQKCQRQQPYFEEHKCRQVCQQRHQTDEIVRIGDAERAYDRCQRTCPGSGSRKWQCQRTCQDAYEEALRRERGETEHGHDRESERERERREREREREEREREEGHGGGGGDRYPRKETYRRCMKECEDKEEGFARQRQCKLRCEGHGRQEHRGHREEEQREEERGRRTYDNKQHKSKEKKETDNPYLFKSQSFDSRYSTQEGNMKVLPRFSEKSDLLRGIDKFRVALYEANPNTFMLPHHWDADSVLFVIGGRAAMTFVTQQNRETFNLERGDVLMVPSGTTSYLVNTHNNEKLQIAELLHPVNNPGQYEQFFGIGGEEPESFFNSFSTEILQAALDVPKEQLEKLFKQHKEGAIIKARQGQVRAMAQQGMSTRRFVASKGLLNLLNEEPIYVNDHGEFYEVSPNEFRQLENLDISLTYTDIKQGSMMAPHFNSRATVIMLVEEGSGYIEMACPHIKKQSNKEQQTSSPRYQKLQSNLSKGDALVIPAGHPISIVSSENENLRLVGFGINARNNQRNFLAGQENMINQLDNEAKELSFKMPAMEVEGLFQRQQNSYFMAGPQQLQQQQQQQQQSRLLSVLDFAGF